MAFEVLFHPKAVRILNKLEVSIQKEIKNKLKELKAKPDSGKKLKYSNFWRIRIEDYRVIYEIDHDRKQIIVLFIGHREKVYDDFSKLIS